MALVKYNNNSISAVTAASSLPTGAMTLIKEQTASSSASVSFIHGTSDVVFDSTYPIYKIVYINVHPQTDDVHFQGNFTTDGTNWNVTKTTSSFYAYHSESGSASLLSYASAYDVAQGTGDFQFQQSAGNANDQPVNGEMYIFNPSSTTYIKHFLATHSGNIGDVYEINTFHGGYCNTTSAVTGVRFIWSSGNIDAGTFKLYGIKDS